MTHWEAVENTTMFLLEETGDIRGTWQGRMTAKEQRALFGVFLGKGYLTISGTDEKIYHTIKVCFGLDWHTSKVWDMKHQGVGGEIVVHEN